MDAGSMQKQAGLSRSSQHIGGTGKVGSGGLTASTSPSDQRLERYHAGNDPAAGAVAATSWACARDESHSAGQR